jgi:thymidylate synthase (FAD)
VITNLNVELVYYAPQDPDKYIAMVMRRTRDSSNIAKIQKSFIDKKERIEKLVRLAKKKKHYGVFEHVIYWFNVEQISRVLTHQLVRHRIASYAQLSGRATNIDNGYVIPSLDYLEDKSRRTEIREFFESKYKEQFKAYRWLLQKGIRIEDARYLLPNGQWTCILITINARSLMHMIHMRISTEAHWEIRELARRMWDLVKPTAPALWESIPDDV